MKYKFIYTIIINLLIFLLFILAVEASIWAVENYKLKKEGVFNEKIKYIKFHTAIKNDHHRLLKMAKYSDNWGRGVTGKNYNSRPIVIFGCSYAYGYNLEQTQTFSYKLAELTKRPIYNQAYTGWGIQHMLYQSKLPELYNKIKNPEYVIFVYIPDHLRRLYLISFSSWNILSDEFNIRYKNVNGKLEEIKNYNMFFSINLRDYI